MFQIFDPVALRVLLRKPQTKVASVIHRIRVTPICVLPLALFSTQCTVGNENAGAVVRDSAGVTIVESHEPTWGEGEGWWLSDEPSLTIGMDEGPEEYSLFSVRAVLRLPNGNIVIANGGSDELRYYDSLGSYLYAVGQDGYGPGEFKDMSGMWLALDTLVIADGGQDRVSLFSAAGDFGRTVMLDQEGRFAPAAAGVFSDGSIKPII